MIGSNGKYCGWYAASDIFSEFEDKKEARIMHNNTTTTTTNNNNIKQ